MRPPLACVAFFPSDSLFPPPPLPPQVKALGTGGPPQGKAPKVSSLRNFPVRFFFSSRSPYAFSLPFRLPFPPPWVWPCGFCSF